MTTFADLRKTSPQIQDQYQRFVTQQNGGRSQPDWNAFRQYQKSQGQPDPGADEPTDLQQIHQQASSSQR